MQGVLLLNSVLTVEQDQPASHAKYGWQSFTDYIISYISDTKDFVEYIRLCDGLEHISHLATAFSTNHDIEPAVSDVWRLYLSLNNSKKPIVSGAFTEHGVPRMGDMMQLFRHDRQDLIAKPMSVSPSQPLATSAIAKIAAKTCSTASNMVFHSKLCRLR